MPYYPATRWRSGKEVLEPSSQVRSLQLAALSRVPKLSLRSLAWILLFLGFNFRPCVRLALLFFSRSGIGIEANISSFIWQVFGDTLSNVLLASSCLFAILSSQVWKREEKLCTLFGYCLFPVSGGSVLSCTRRRLRKFR